MIGRFDVPDIGGLPEQAETFVRLELKPAVGAPIAFRDGLLKFSLGTLLSIRHRIASKFE